MGGCHAAGGRGGRGWGHLWRAGGADADGVPGRRRRGQGRAAGRGMPQVGAGPGRRCGAAAATPRSQAARRLKALRATSLDASIAVHDSGSAPAQPQTPSASSGSGSAGMCLPPADAHAGTAVTTQPAAAPKPSVGDEVELVCQSLAFGGKVNDGEPSVKTAQSDRARNHAAGLDG